MLQGTKWDKVGEHGTSRKPLSDSIIISLNKHSTKPVCRAKYTVGAERDPCHWVYLNYTCKNSGQRNFFPSNRRIFHSGNRLRKYIKNENKICHEVTLQPNQECIKLTSLKVQSPSVAIKKVTFQKSDPKHYIGKPSKSSWKMHIMVKLCTYFKNFILFLFIYILYIYFYCSKLFSKINLNSIFPQTFEVPSTSHQFCFPSIS